MIPSPPLMLMFNMKLYHKEVRPQTFMIYTQGSQKNYNLKYKSSI